MDVARIQRPLLVVAQESFDGVDLAGFDEVVIVPDALFARISDTNSPQGILAVVNWPELLARTGQEPLLIVADGIRDPGNLGTIIRCAAALGATGVVCGPGSTDPYAPKVVRAAAAAQWAIPVVPSADFEPDEIFADVQLFVADGSSETRIDGVDMTMSTAIVVGNEGFGVSDEMLALPHMRVAIPMRETVESLNAGVAAGIILYEAQRQRNSGSRW
jgi:RNA methyltransferase, TrmH family